MLSEFQVFRAHHLAALNILPAPSYRKACGPVLYRGEICTDEVTCISDASLFWRSVMTPLRKLMARSVFIDCR